RTDLLRSGSPRAPGISLMATDLFSTLDDDASLDSGRRFAAVVADYFAAAHAGDGPVSTGLSHAELSSRFDEPLPIDGAPLDDVLARVRREVLSDANRLAHPMAFG